MTATAAAPQPAVRRLLCARCGVAFECGSGGQTCWCADEAYRMPMPAAGEDCLCPQCLRAAAALHFGRAS